MSRPSTATRRYNTVAILLHWTLAGLILAQIAGGIVMHNLAYSDLKVSLYQWHKSFGLTVLALALLRLVWRLTHRPPPLAPETLAHMPAWQVAASKFTHIALYALMIGIPLLGWLYISATPRGFPTELFGLIPVPDLPVTRGEASADLLKQLHKISAIGMLALIGVHAGAALHHHYRRGDTVLLRMAPWLKRRSPSETTS